MMRWSGVCWHRWVAVAVTHGTFVVITGDATAVLQRCTKCGDVRTKSLNGHWSLVDLSAGRGRGND